jgi:hypothetical protein
MNNGNCPPLLFVRLNLKLALLWRVFGKQFLITQENKDLDIVQAQGETHLAAESSYAIGKN